MNREALSNRTGNLSHSLGVADLGSKEAVISILTASFQNDPIVRWMYPEQDRYERFFREFLMCYGCDPFTHESGVYHANGLQGALTWLPSGVHPDPEELKRFFLRTVVPSRAVEAVKLFDTSGRHQPRYSHCCVAFVGVDPLYQGKGYGSALMSYACDLYDRVDEPAYIESSNPRNIPLYERFGFELLARTVVGDSPPLFAMLRGPR